MTRPSLATFQSQSIRTAPVWCFLFVTLFNLQGTRRSQRNIAILTLFISFVKSFFQKIFDSRSECFSQQLFQSTTSSWLCQVLFSEVFDSARCPLAATLLGYHIFRCLSTTFFEVFRLSFQAASPSSHFVTTAPTALLEYQTFPHLSTPFFTFFDACYLHHLSPPIQCLKSTGQIRSSVV